MKVLLCLLASWVALVKAETIGEIDLSKIDPALIIRPPEGIDFPGCFKDMVTADRDGNGFIAQKEYLGFIQEYGKRICWEQDRLTLEQQAAFNSLSCMCRSKEGHDPRCCLGQNAKLFTAGALTPSTRTEEQLFFLRTVCTVTDGTIDSECPPIIKDRKEPPPVVIVPVDLSSVAPPAEDGGLSDGAKWGIIAAAIFLGLLLCFLCCCCCVFRRKKRKDMEEEEVVTTAVPGKDFPDEEQAPPEQSPRGAMDMDPAEDGGEGGGRGGGHETEEGDEGEGRRKRGSNYADEPEEDEKRRWGGPPLPPPEPEDPERVVLKPIPPKDPEEDPDWDYPAREINEHRDTDEMSAQEFERYVPDGGVDIPEREGKDPVTWKRDWQRGKKPEDDEVDNRKHRIQTGLGEGEVWDKLNEKDDATTSVGPSPGGDVFDWVVQSALGVLDKSDEQGHLNDDNSTVMS